MRFIDSDAGVIRCCRDSIRRTTVDDVDGTIVSCDECGSYLRFHHGLWRLDVTHGLYQPLKQEMAEAATRRETEIPILRKEQN